jgi:hypothetical protein
MRRVSGYSDTTKYFVGPVAVSQHRRPCAGANHPLLTYRSPSLPSAQVALLTCLDTPIMSIIDRWSS